ncbi:protein NETWORKED 3A-like [Zingiber officinale]|uniref:protein NETWORKED 3A-like n=1 Tax=Zingiber officinale TaxID=94328 RepID=UPI001C4D4FB6|nr:protein NETWORKED 3A-like [Zingiber officinale]
MAKRQSLPWWLNGCKLDKKTKAILELIEEEAESFLQSAERYAKKRPELIHMIEDFHLANKLLAQRYDRLKSEMKNHHNVDLTLPMSSGCYIGKLIEHIYVAQALGTYDGGESEVSDAEEVMENGVEDSEAMNGEVEWLKLDNQMLMDEEPQSCSPLCMYSSEESELCEAKEANDGVDDEEAAAAAMIKEIEKLKMENKMLKAKAEARDEREKRSHKAALFVN